MKTKDLIQLIIALLIFAVAGWLIYGQVVPQKASTATNKSTTIVKVTPVPADFDQSALSAVSDSTKNRDFYTAPDLTSGLGNNQPFGPLH